MIGQEIGNQIMRFGQLLVYNMTSIFLEKS